MFNMAERIQQSGEENERELYDSICNATKKAEIEGDAHLQAAVAAARAPLAPDSHGPVELNRWSNCFDNLRLEAAYCRKMNANCDNYDYVLVILKLAMAVLDLALAVRSIRRVAPIHGAAVLLHDLSWTSAYHIWHILVAVMCGTSLAVFHGTKTWYRSNRGRTLWWVVAALWLAEGINIFVSAHVMVWGYALEAVASCIYISFLHLVPFREHLRLRVFGFVCQVAAILATQDRLEFYILLSGVAVGHLVGMGIAYYLDRKARSMFLKSLPRWLVSEVTGSGIPSSYRTSLSRQMWSIFYPGLVDMPEQIESSVSPTAVGLGVTPQGAPRRALGGFAGGFGGVSGLKCNNTTGALYNPIPLSSPSSSSSSDHNGDVDTSTTDGEWAPVFNESGLCSSQSNRAQRWSLGLQVSPQYGTLSTSSACSQVHSGSTSTWQQSQYRRGNHDLDDAW